MASYVWTGSAFQGQSFVASAFMLDDNDNTWFWEQNYQVFFPFTVLNGAPTYTGNGVGQTLPANTNLSTLDNYAFSIGTFDASVIGARAAQFNANSSNVLGAVTQTPAALVNNAIAAAVNSNQSLQQAVSSAAGLLTNPTLNFIMKDITGWNGGQSLVTSLQGFITNHQANIASVTGAIQSISDFKKKILGAVTRQADAIQSLQGGIAKIQGQGTFTGLVCAFPAEFGPVVSLLNNSQANLASKLPSFLPKAVISGGAGFVEGMFNAEFGALLPQICNPIDKIFLDINKLESGGLSLLNSIPIIGFGSLGAQTSAVNQVASLLNNLVSSFPATSTIAPQSTTITNVEQMFLSTNQYASQQLGLNTNSSTQSAISAITSLISGKPVPSTKTTTTVASSNPADSSQGGSFTSTAALSAYTAPTVYQPPVNITTSPDPSIAQSQNATSVAQTQANQANSTNTVVRGNCLNNINDVPLKPRSKPFDGSLGNYDSSQPIPF
jgi:hypothetical protein